MMCRVVSHGAIALALLCLSVIPAAADQSQLRPRVERPGGLSTAGLAVMTANLKHKDRPEELKIVVDHLRADVPRLPDFILCQEVVFKRSGPEKNTAEVLARHLGYHTRGTKRTSDKEGLAIVSRYPFEYYGEKHLKAQTSRLLLGFRRVSVMGEFQVPGVGRVRVVNVHFTNWGFEARIRRKQLEETLAWINERDDKVPAAVTFLGGDFNAELHEGEMKALREPKLGTPAFVSYNGKTPTKGSVGGDQKTRIDLLFVATPDRNWKLGREQVLWKDGLSWGPHTDDVFYLSDHLPVYHLYNPPAATFAGAEGEARSIP